MKYSQITMGMPTTIEIIDSQAREEDIREVFAYFDYIDNTFSTYKKNSEISRLNRGELDKNSCSHIVLEILQLCEQTKEETHGYFNINHNGYIDPSGIVKGYAIQKGTEMLTTKKYENFFVEIAGDVALSGRNVHHKKWAVGIRNPFNTREIVKVLHIENNGVATSGTYIRGQHIYNPFEKKEITDIASLTVVASTIFDADRFATAAFAMGEKGIEFLQNLENIEGYMIRKDKMAVYTSGFEKYLVS